MSHSEESPRRAFLRSCATAVAGFLASGPLSRVERLLAATGPEDPEVPNEEVARILEKISGGRPIRRGHVTSRHAARRRGRPSGAGNHRKRSADDRGAVRKGVHLIVDHNPDAHLAAFHLTPALGKVSISTRIKMKRTTWVRAILETSTGDVWAGYARVLVTLNGCG